MALHGSRSGLGKGEAGSINWDPTVQGETKIGQESKGRQKWLLKGPGNDNPLNKRMGCQWWERAWIEGPGCREERMAA